eukprot:TRINITY_DN1384_c0_g1_i1.p1 TRINITY_DN1384_c0_g1~~TRINITY_DN1384_c0_g1_i1.p1  ORF type:complete len:392 (-),score=50.50 TRINITY_DN1384_c0_g1_i1:130-1305(-)
MTVIQMMKEISFFLWHTALYILYRVFRLHLSFWQTFWSWNNVNKDEAYLKTIGIIGGGFAGCSIAKQLQGEFKITLFDPKVYWEFTPSVLRTFVEPQHLANIQVRFSDFLQRITIVPHLVREVNDTTVITADGQNYSFDYLVLAAGSRYETPFVNSQITFSGRDALTPEASRKLQQAKRILIIGGGLVGVELAAEFAETFKDKVIIIVTSADALLARSPSMAQRYAHKYFMRKGVNLLFNERIVEVNGTTFKSQNGTSIEADVAFICTGIVPNSEALHNYFHESLNEKGFVHVDDHLRLQGHNNIFAAGDITAIEQEKLAQTASFEADVVASNILRTEQGLPLCVYAPSDRPMLVSLGKFDGIFAYKSYSLCGFLPALMKEVVEWKERAVR